MAYTETTAKNINLASAGLAAGIAGFYMHKNKTDVKNLILFSLLAGVAVWFIMKQLSGLLVSASSKPKTGVADSDDMDSNWDPTPVTDRIYEAINENYIDVFFGDYDTGAYEQCLSLSDIGLEAVYNDWTDRYWADDNKTLTSALATHNIYFLAGDSNNASLLRDQLVSRLQNIGLN